MDVYNNLEETKPAVHLMEIEMSKVPEDYPALSIPLYKDSELVTSPFPNYFLIC